MYPLRMWLNLGDGQERVPGVISRCDTCEALLERMKHDVMASSMSTAEDGVAGMVLISPSGYQRHRLMGSAAELEMRLEDFDALCDFWECRVLKEGRIEEEDEQTHLLDMLPRAPSMDDSGGENPWSYPSGEQKLISAGYAVIVRTRLLLWAPK